MIYTYWETPDDDCKALCPDCSAHARYEKWTGFRELDPRTLEGDPAPHCEHCGQSDLDEVVRLGQWIGPIRVAASLMDDDIREGLSDQMSPCAGQDFLDAYCVAHKAKFGTGFVVN